MAKRESKATQPGEGKMLSARVPPDLHRRIRQRALDADSSVQQIVIDALEEYLKKRGA